MKVISVQDLNLDQCVRAAQRQRVVVTRRGKPVAVVTGVAGMDLEQLELGTSDRFWKLIRQRRRQRTITRRDWKRSSVPNAVVTMPWAKLPSPGARGRT